MVRKHIEDSARSELQGIRLRDEMARVPRDQADIPTPVRIPSHHLKHSSRASKIFPDRESYTLPAVQLPDGTYIMDSWDIAQELEKQYPSPSLHLDSPLRDRYNELLNPSFAALRPEVIRYVPEALLNEASLEHWEVTRTPRIGMPLPQYVAEQGGPQAYKKAAPYLQQITALLKENDAGVFFEGETISFVDFIHAGFLIMFRRYGRDSFDQLLEATGDPELHLKFLEALKPWIERDDH
ncbi:hypothetical protein F5Y14DRAFT_431260 [Nemania sp. NC0429]|nr:hypothetical protein F5Y14DRAFT_431260 [Nemania sp. NC0429]